MKQYYTGGIISVDPNHQNFVVATDVTGGSPVNLQPLQSPYAMAGTTTGRFAGLGSNDNCVAQQASTSPADPIEDDAAWNEMMVGARFDELRNAIQGLRRMQLHLYQSDDKQVQLLNRLRLEMAGHTHAANGAATLPIERYV